MTDEQPRLITHPELDRAFDKFRLELNVSLAQFFGKLERHIDKRFDKYEAKVDARIERQDRLLDSLAYRVSTDDQERVAMANQLKRHEGWIVQLVEPKKLIPKPQIERS
jgi:hypothetical protein